MHDASAGGRVSLPCSTVLLVVIISVLPWESDNYFTGSFDSIAIVKAVLALIALAAAGALATTTPHVHAVPVTPVLYTAAYLLCTLLGGLVARELGPSLVIAVRVAILLATIALLAHRYPASSLLPSLVLALGLLAALSAVTGLSSLAGGRLWGGFPRMHPNELAFESAVVLAWVVGKVAQGRDTFAHLGFGAVALGILLATGSRTSLLVMVPTVAVLMLTARAIRIRTGLMIGLLIPVVVWAATGTDILVQLIGRGSDANNLGTLSNRTIAWQAALAPKDSVWEALFGSGLATKQIAVLGQWWTYQILDSSWVSALVQGGFLGLLVCVAWVLHSTLQVIQTSERALLGWQVAMLVLLTARGVLESGLFDASTAFVVLACVSLGNGTVVRRWRPQWVSPPLVRPGSPPPEEAMFENLRRI